MTHFITVNGRMVNVAYIKEIRLGCIIVANTEMISFAMTGGSSTQYSVSQSSWKDKKDSIIKITPEEHESIMKQFDYHAIIKDLSEENERLKLELQYRPGGSGYDAAKSHFETAISN